MESFTLGYSMAATRKWERNGFDLVQSQVRHHPFFLSPKAPANPLHIGRRQKIKVQVQREGPGWQQPHVLMGKPRGLIGSW